MDSIVEYITLSDAAKRLPTPNGRRIATSTLFRWATKGCSGVRLETRRFGKRIFTTLAALDAFGKALADAGPLPHRTQEQTDRDRTPNQTSAAVAEAKASLAKSGI
jgi:hypothetical protein